MGDLIIVGYMEVIIDRYGDTYKDIPLTYTHQHQRKRLAHPLLTVKEHIGDNIFRRISKAWFTASGRSAQTATSLSRADRS